jgi:hypothetical protein
MIRQLLQGFQAEPSLRVARRRFNVWSGRNELADFVHAPGLLAGARMGFTPLERGIAFA